jgi:hypothetical protein
MAHHACTHPESLPKEPVDDTPPETEEEPSLTSEASESGDLLTEGATDDAEAAAASDSSSQVNVPARPAGVPMGGVALPFGAMRTGMPVMPPGGVALRPTGSPLSLSGAKPAPPAR